MSSGGADPPVFSLDVRDGGDGRTTVAVGGELDLASADEFLRAVREAFDAGGVVIDLGEVTFMDSAGVRVMNTVLRESADRGRELRVKPKIQRNVVQVLELTGMMGLLPVEAAG